MGLSKIFAWMRKDKKPAWKSKSFDEANRAVERITDQQLLWEIAKDLEVPDHARKRAISKIIASLESTNDQKVFLNIAQDAKAPLEIRYKAVAMLMDQAFLAEIAHISSPVQSNAIRKLSDQDLIQNLARHDHESVRIAAIKVLTDQSVLEDIARNDTDGRVRDEAMWKLPIATREKIQQELCGKGIHFFTTPWMQGDSTLTPARHLFYCQYCHADNGKPKR